MLVSKFWRRKPTRWIYTVDFDGTLVEDKYPEVGDNKKLAVWATNKLLSFGHDVIIWTCRVDSYEAAVRRWANYNLDSFVYINTSTIKTLQKYGKDNRKVFANRYCDNKNPLWFDLIWLWIVFEGWLAWKGWIK